MNREAFENDEEFLNEATQTIDKVILSKSRNGDKRGGANSYDPPSSPLLNGCSWKCENFLLVCRKYFPACVCMKRWLLLF